MYDKMLDCNCGDKAFGFYCQVCQLRYPLAGLVCVENHAWNSHPDTDNKPMPLS